MSRALKIIVNLRSKIITFLSKIMYNIGGRYVKAEQILYFYKKMFRPHVQSKF